MLRFLHLLLVVLIGIAAYSQNYALRFNGTAFNDQDRVKIPIDAPAKAVDVGAAFTIEFKLRATLANNPLGGSVISGPTDDWVLGHVIIDRDIFGPGDHGDYGVSLAGGRICFGVNNGSSGYTLVSSVNVADDQWHDIALCRVNDGAGTLRLFIDGVLNQTVSSGVTGDLSYRDDRSTVWANDPFLVFGAEKHDYDPLTYPSYSGLLDEVRISNIARYSTNYTPQSVFIDDANTVGLYHFDEGSGTAVHDSASLAGNGSNGFLTTNQQGEPLTEWVMLSASSAGCTDPLGCNYDPQASSDDGSCTFATFGFDCDGALVDSDGDFVYDVFECPDYPNCLDTDGDGIPNYLDTDDDGDGVLTVFELGSSYNPTFNTGALDSDGDGIRNYLDTDDDGDGVLTFFERGSLYNQQINTNALDTDADGVPNYLDDDDDGDGILTIDELGPSYNPATNTGALDSNGNGIPDYLDPAPNAPIEGCTNPLATNYDAMAEADDGSCFNAFCGPGTVWDNNLSLCVSEEQSCVGDLNGDGLINTTDLGIFLSVFGSICD